MYLSTRSLLALIPALAAAQTCTNTANFEYTTNGGVVKPDFCTWLASAPPEKSLARKERYCLPGKGHPDVITNCALACYGEDLNFAYPALNISGETFDCVFLNQHSDPAKNLLRQSRYCTDDQQIVNCGVSCGLCSGVTTTPAPTQAPTKSPTAAPTTAPVTPGPTPTQPFPAPSRPPSPMPSPFPTLRPTSSPSDAPSMVPSDIPSDSPSKVPSDEPSMLPSLTPSDSPSMVPSDVPSDSPSKVPSDEPSMVPSMVPSDQPSSLPSKEPSRSPSSIPSDQPSQVPSKEPSRSPSNNPTSSIKPSPSPSARPSGPTTSPTAAPVVTPTTSAPTKAPTPTISTPSCDDFPDKFKFTKKKILTCDDMTEYRCSKIKGKSLCPNACETTADYCGDNLTDGKGRVEYSVNTSGETVYKGCAFVRRVPEKIALRCSKMNVKIACRATCEGY